MRKDTRKGDRHLSTADRHKPQTFTCNECGNLVTGRRKRGMCERCYDRQRAAAGKGNRHMSKRYDTEHDFSKLHFVAWDGEGYERIPSDPSTHEYVMLVSSAGHVIQHADHSGLSTVECFEGLLAAAKDQDKHTVNVIFAGGYDANMMLGDLPRKLVAQVWDTKRNDRGVNWRISDHLGYHIYYRQRKELRIARYNPQNYCEWLEKDGKRIMGPRIYSAKITLWDVFGFFQAAFVDVLAEWLADDMTAEERAYIAQMKAARHHFTRDNWTEILAYCQREVDLLAKLMVKLHRNLIDADIQIARWDGPGAIASSLLRRHKIKDYRSWGKRVANGAVVEEWDTAPLPVREAARYAYAGGRIEMLKVGHEPIGGREMHHYDIRSAYPAAMAPLPCLKHGSWKHTTRFSPGAFGLWRVRWDISLNDYLMPFFHRDHNGAIRFPFKGEGWYHTPEVAAAVDLSSSHDNSGGVEVREGWVYTPGCGHQPFEFVQALYDQRAVWKAQGNEAQRVLKLGINSLYGKLAQRVGMREVRDKDKKVTEQAPPAYHELLWAGAITSQTRATLYRAGMQRPWSTILIMTDGITSYDRLDLPESDKLGDWEYEPWDGLIMVQAGVYWPHTPPTAKNPDGKWHPHYRGFDKGQLSTDRILEAWRNKERQLEADSTRFITMGGALAGDERWPLWRSWRTITRKLMLYPLNPRTEKRIPIDAPSIMLDCSVLASSLVDTLPCLPASEDYMSAKHKLPWLDELAYANIGTNGDYDGIDPTIYIDEFEETLYE